MSGEQSPAAGVPTCYRHPGRETYIRCQRCDRAICPDCMRDASVGFQCPQCVSEGRKSTRSGRTAYGGLRPTNAGITSIVLIAINAAVFLLIQVTGAAASSWFYRLALLPSGVCASKAHAGGVYPLTSERTCALGTNPPHDGQWFPGVSDGAWWQLMTSAFTHVEVWHIGFNMLALWFLGPQLEQAIGRVRFLALYLISALAGSTMAYWFAPVHGETLGASGAIFGLMGALLVLALKVKANPQQILLWIGINFVFTVLFPNISWQGHLGGFLGGVLVAAVLVYAPRPHRALWQSLGLGAFTLALLAAVALRTATLV